jgi:uncharacterized phage protein gp47/JayE
MPFSLIPPSLLQRFEAQTTDPTVKAKLQADEAAWARSAAKSDFLTKATTGLVKETTPAKVAGYLQAVGSYVPVAGPVLVKAGQVMAQDTAAKEARAKQEEAAFAASQGIGASGLDPGPGGATDVTPLLVLIGGVVLLAVLLEA